MKTKELIETEVLVCDWCGAAHALGGHRANGLVVKEFGEYHLCCRAEPKESNPAPRANDWPDTFIIHALEDTSYDRSLGMVERTLAERDPPMSCFDKVLAFAVRCRVADVVDTDGEIKLMACRECGVKFDSGHPHIADGLCAKCAPTGKTCDVCHRALDADPEVGAPRRCPGCEAAALAG